MKFPNERPQRRKTPSFSSILLDSTHHSINEIKEVEQTKSNFNRKDNLHVVEQDVKSLRRAIMLEKWMETHSSVSSSSADSTYFSETDYASRCSPKSSFSYSHAERTRNGVHESRFTMTKSRVLKIYGDFKKVKQPISPGTKIANFLISVFSSRNLKNHHHQHQSSPSEGWNSMRKSRSVKDTTIFSSFTSRSCLSKAPSSRTKPKRSDRFGNEQYDQRIMAMPEIGSNFIKENIHTLPSFQEMKSEKYNARDILKQDESEDDDIRSCTSSDLFELENISVAGNQIHMEELPVFGTTNMKINQAIANACLFS